MKYRIVIEIRESGNKFYWIQKKILGFWIDQRFCSSEDMAMEIIKGNYKN